MVSCTKWLEFDGFTGGSGSVLGCPVLRWPRTLVTEDKRRGSSSQRGGEAPQLLTEVREERGGEAPQLLAEVREEVQLLTESRCSPPATQRGGAAPQLLTGQRRGAAPHSEEDRKEVQLLTARRCSSSQIGREAPQLLTEVREERAGAAPKATQRGGAAPQLLTGQRGGATPHREEVQPLSAT
ncbi:unnamed protein product [Pleuronectes platessa]|uniref:Uncharacterized protein n=1 Tax=Pleuronectes platessa TaxID=8262 RepID=A0A9N7UGM0_PLEPL|nr:unnamed protein product [Pleuronectes platessa]